MKLFLASGSPRRLELLRASGYRPQRVEQLADEATIAGELAADYVQRLAREKALDAISRLAPELKGPQEGVVLAADTAVVLDGQILGKPADSTEALAGLLALRGRAHEVMTGVALRRTTPNGASHAAVERTTVHFNHFPDAEAHTYVAGGTVYDKAGGYGLQEIPPNWISRVDGLSSNVIGLPAEIGIHATELRD
jgi:septum formation protein